MYRLGEQTLPKLVTLTFDRSGDEHKATMIRRIAIAWVNKEIMAATINHHRTEEQVHADRLNQLITFARSIRFSSYKKMVHWWIEREKKNPEDLFNEFIADRTARSESVKKGTATPS